MKLIDKQTISNIENEIDNLVNDISDFGSRITSEVQEINEEFEEQMESLETYKGNILNKINESKFSDKLKKRISYQLDVIFDELNDEKFNLNFNVDQNEILDNINSSRDFIRSIAGNDLDFIKDKMDEFSSRLDVINNFIENVTIKTRSFILDRRSEVIAIRDRKNPSYSKHAELNNSLPDVFCLIEGQFDSEKGWIIPDKIIESLKLTVKKLNNLN